jgi:hypothetical protein
MMYAMALYLKTAQYMATPEHDIFTSNVALTCSQMSSIPRLISTFSPGLNAGNPDNRNQIRTKRRQRLCPLTKIRAASTPERVTQETIPAATRCLWCCQHGCEQALLLSLVYLNSLPVNLAIQQHNLALL